MGLTIHYRLTFRPEAGNLGEFQARWLVEETRNLAKKWKRQGRVDAVGPLLTDTEARKLAEAYVTYHHPEYGEQDMDVWPVQAWVFVVEVGHDCEPLRLGLARYPAEAWHLCGRHRTRLGQAWQLRGFSKTQYASLHGWEHFHRCHTAVIDLLAEARSPGLAVRINDEGDYWPRRNLRALRRNLNEMNGVVAAAVGAMKDWAEERGEAPVQSPILAHPQFERLEAEGAARGYAAQLREVLK